MKSAFDKTTGNANEDDNINHAFQPVKASNSYAKTSSELISNNLRRSTRASLKKENVKNKRSKTTSYQHSESHNEQSHASSIEEMNLEEVEPTDANPAK